MKRAFFHLVDESEADAAAKEAELRSSEAAAALEGHEMGPEASAAGEGGAVEATYTIAQPQHPHIDDSVTAAGTDGVVGAASYPWAGQKECVEHEAGSGVSDIEMAPAALVVPAAPLMLAPLGDGSGPKLPLSRLREVRRGGG